jgi:hypothetical protein
MLDVLTDSFLVIYKLFQEQTKAHHAEAGKRNRPPYLSSSDMSGWRGMPIAMVCMHIMRGRSSGGIPVPMCSPGRRRTGGGQDWVRW